MRQKNSKPGRTASSWFMKGEVRQFMCVPATPGGQLCGLLRDRLRDFKGPDKGTTKFTERAGKSVMSGLVSDDPFPKAGCTFKDPNVSLEQDVIEQMYATKLCAKNAYQMVKIMLPDP